MGGEFFLSIFKTRAIVIRTQDINENDKLLWLFTEKLGKVSAVARGAKKGKSKFMASSQLFCYGEYVLYKGKSLYTINEAQIIDSFQGLLKDLEHITYASYLCELIQISMQDEESDRSLFMHLISAFYFMKNEITDIEILARAFEIKLLKSTGFSFELEQCIVCGCKISTSDYISCQYGGGVCRDCARVNGIKVSYSAYNALRALSKMSFQNIYRVTLSAQVKEELYKILSTTISQNYFKKPKSLETLNYLKGVIVND